METARLSCAAVSLARDPRTAFRRARDLGLAAVELDARSDLAPEQLTQTGLRQLRKWLGDEGIVVSAVTFRTRGGYADSERLEGRIAATKKALDVAYAVGARIVLNHIGDIPPEDAGPQRQLLIDVLTDIGAWGQRAGATLCAEVGRTAPDELARLIEALPGGSLSCDLVSGAVVVHGHDPVAAVATLGPHIESVHATDAVAGAFAGRGRAVVLGTGQVDLPAMFAALEERGYRGWIGLEPVEERTAREEIAAAISFMRAL